jgi:hypothetical protein
MPLLERSLAIIKLNILYALRAENQGKKRSDEDGTGSVHVGQIRRFRHPALPVQAWLRASNATSAHVPGKPALGRFGLNVY